LAPDRIALPPPLKKEDQGVKHGHKSDRNSCEKICDKGSNFEPSPIADAIGDKI
jgi:hypothetical protein